MNHSLYIVLFLHQTTTSVAAGDGDYGCISYYSYIKPQPIRRTSYLDFVVYRTIPTSNHNYRGDQSEDQFVVYRTIPTSNHNFEDSGLSIFELYIVLFLHQTTTAPNRYCQTPCCISYYSYIKPQRS